MHWLSTDKRDLLRDSKVIRSFSFPTAVAVSKTNHAVSNWRKRICDVPCYVKHRQGILGDLHVSNSYSSNPDDAAVFKYTMESTKYYPSFLRKSERHLGLATTSFKSDIPLPYFSFAEYEIQSKEVDFDSAIKGASFAARNCHSNSGREKIIKELMHHFRVDSLSQCLNNKEWPKDVKRSDKNAMMRKYLFHLAFENSVEDDYITEKLWGSLQSGSLPIYLGAPNVHEHVPFKAIIAVDDFKSIKDLADYLEYLSYNKTAYNQYHEWRYKPLPYEFFEKYNITRTHSECRACRMLYASKNGFKFNHKTQEIEY